MALMKNLFIFLLLVCVNFQIFAQNVAFRQDHQIIVLNPSHDTLRNAWTGGLNSPQFSKIHLNNDSIEDLFIFDRTANKIFTFLAENNRWKYAPQYERMFPQDLRAWVLLKDYDCDGKKDLFAHSIQGIQVWKNNTTQSNFMNWSQTTPALTTIGFSGAINLQVSSEDLPAIADIDNDGDLDVLTFQFATGTYIEYHENKGLNCGDLSFKRERNCWGKFAEGLTCNDFTLNVNCPFPGGRVKPNEHYTQMHAGSTILALDLTGNGIKDVLLGDVGCRNLVKMTNSTLGADATMIAFDTAYPSSNPVNLHLFPAAFYEDVNFDNKPDLLVAPNLSNNEGNLANFRQSAWLYENISNSNIPNFQFITHSFLQKEMIELGEETYPSAADIDGDGDLDLIVGNKGDRYSNGFYATLTLFENIGTATQPIFKQTNNDWLGFSQQQWLYIKPTWQDMNGDGKIDLVFTATNSSLTQFVLRYLPNSSTTQHAVFDINNFVAITLNPAVGFADFPAFTDIDQDGKIDLLLGKGNNSGRIFYYKNIGTAQNPTYELVSNQYGGITNAGSNQNIQIHLSIADFDLDGNLDLITGDRSGKLRYYSNFKNATSPFLPNEEIIFNPAWGLTTDYHIGNHVMPLAISLDNNDYPDLMIGTRTGGLVYFLNNIPITSLSQKEAEKVKLTIFPNPSQHSFYLTSAIAGKVKVINQLGQTVAETYYDTPNIAKTISVQHLPQGIYYVQLSDSYQHLVRRIVVK